MTSRQVLAYNYIVYTRDEQTQRVVTLTSCKLTHTYTHTRLTALFPGLPG